MIAAVLVALGLGMASLAVCGLLGLRAYLAFRREGQKGDSAAVADLSKRLAELEQKAAGWELQKLRR